MGALLMGACLAGAPPAGATKPMPGVRWVRLIRNENGLKAIYHVMLERRFKVGELDTVARDIQRAAPKNQLMSILYFLRGMSTEQGPWATSNFNRSLASFEIQINEPVIRTNPPDPDLLASGQ